MERILILIAADDFADAQSALLSARNASKAPEALSFGLSLTAEPTDEEMQEMQQLGLVQYLCPGPDVWSAMPHLWQGEDFVLLAHPAMRFAQGQRCRF